MVAKKPMDRLQAEGKSSALGAVTINLRDIPIRVLPAEEWHKKALTHLRTGDYDSWAEGAVHPDDVAAFVDADVKVKDVNRFFEDWGAASGQDVGESAAS